MTYPSDRGVLGDAQYESLMLALRQRDESITRARISEAHAIRATEELRTIRAELMTLRAALQALGDRREAVARIIDLVGCVTLLGEEGASRWAYPDRRREALLKAETILAMVQRLDVALTQNVVVLPPVENPAWLTWVSEQVSDLAAEEIVAWAHRQPERYLVRGRIV